MAKAVVSSGGGGSFGKGVDWADALVAELARPEPPAGARTIDELYAKTNRKMGRKNFANILAERKDLASGMFMRGGRSLRFYWPK